MDEARLLEKLRALEALFAGASTAGERDAAGYARDRIRERLSEQSAREPEIEYQYSLTNAWSAKLFTALVRRYGLRPYRYPRQRQTTVMVRGPERFLKKTLWPHFVRVDEALQMHLDEVAAHVIARAMETSTADAEVRAESQRALPFDTNNSE